MSRDITLTGPAPQRAPAVRAADPDPVPVRFLQEWGGQGTGPGEFHFPIAIALNQDDELFITDHYNNRVQQFSLEGELLAHFPVLPNPSGIAIAHDGNLYISHFSASRLSAERPPARVSVYRPQGEFLREWGRTGSGDGEFSEPGGIAIGQNGHIYVADQVNRRVQVFDRGGVLLGKWGEYGTGPGQFGGNEPPTSRVGGPQFVAVDSGDNVYTTEASMGRVQKFTAEGRFLLAWGDNEKRPGSFGGEFRAFRTSLRGPIGLCVDAQDHVWVSAVSGRVQQFSGEGEYLRGFGQQQGSEPGQFLAPHGLVADCRGHLYVVDSYNHRVQKFAVSP